MALSRRQYPSKLLLFGEYGVLLGLDALAMPFKKFSGKLERKGEVEDASLLRILDHLKKLENSLPFKINLGGFESDIKKGLKFNSEIPMNYGLGSSGALVASIFDNYFEPKKRGEKTDVRALKTTLALLESLFHGVSSGIDPMVSLLNQPVLVRKSGRVLLIDKPVMPNRRRLRFFLIDSNVPGKTGDMVTQFMEKINEAAFSQNFRMAYQQYSNASISNLLNRNYKRFENSFRALSGFQLEHMSELIPDHVKDLFTLGLESYMYSLKICGSGGGGFFLGATTEKEEVESMVNAPIIFL
jgi:mevalonate kinase